MIVRLLKFYMSLGGLSAYKRRIAVIIISCKAAAKRRKILSCIEMVMHRIFQKVQFF